MKKLLLLLLTISMILSVASCEKNNLNHDVDSSGKTTTEEIKPDEVIKFTQEALKILYIKLGVGGTMSFGIPTNKTDNMFINFMTLSDLCEEKLGFPLDFIDIPTDKEYNAYLSYLNSGLSGDLIFPAKVNGISSYEPTFYWNDQWVEEGIYMDITKYIPQFCPQAILNFEKYPQIKQICSRDDKIYALYAGMPTISALSLIIKNSILEENNLEEVNNFETLLEIMDNMYRGSDSIQENQKIFVKQGDLLLYSIMRKGYYLPWKSSSLGIVLDLDDEYFTPVYLEDTDILDYMHETFSPFYINNYFTDQDDQYFALSEGKQELYLTNRPLLDMKNFARQSTDEKDNFFNKGYSIFIMDAPHIYSTPFDVLPVPVPYSSTQPEKALHFMQWLMTDPDAADILTYGSRIMKLSHYRFSADNVIIPEANNTLYGFYNLVANFSTKAFLCGNKQFNIIEEYRERTYEAIYPPLYRAMDSDHMNYIPAMSFEESIRLQNKDKQSYFNKSLAEWMENPYSTLTPHDIKKGLWEFSDNEKLMDEVKKYVESIHLSAFLQKER